MDPLEITPNVECETNLQFEMLLNEISTFFINLSSSRIDDEIQVAQARVCQFLNLDRSALFQIIDKEYQMLLTHIYQPSEIRTPPELMRVKDFFPWSLKKVLAGEIITISKLTDLPTEAALDRETFSQYGTKSAVIVPLSVEKENILGLLTFSVTREKREWSKTNVQQFKAVAQIFANALARSQADQALKESEARLNIVTETAGAGLWVMETDTGYFWTTPKIRELFCFSPDEQLTDEIFFKVVHPDDREPIQQVMQKAIQSGDDLKCDYRIVLPDGNIRWIYSCGRRRFSSKGQAERLMGVSLDITDSIQDKLKLKERLQFETMLADISSRFVNQPVDQVDFEIEDALRRICIFLKIDISALWLWSDEDPNVLVLKYFYDTQGDSKKIEGMVQEYFPWCVQQMLSGQIVSISSLDELPEEAVRDRESCRLLGIQSNLTIPLVVGNDPLIGVLGFNTVQTKCDWSKDKIARLQLFAQIFANALKRKRMAFQLQDQVDEIVKLKKRLEKDNIYLKQEVDILRDHKEIVGKSSVIKNVLIMSEQVASTESTVILLGETGTGKGLLARTIHGMSSRKDRAMVTVNCAALPPSLIESELFGREKGAYTGALTKMAGRFEVADGSTLFLDEIGELPIEVQSKLLHVLELGQFERLGSTQSQQVNVRIIAATNRDLARDVEDGKFRQDLYYRLNIFPILIPPLRERVEDIPLIVWELVKKFQKKMGKKIESIPVDTMKALQDYHWPGNIRELKNVIEHAMILNKDKSLVVSMSKLISAEVQDVSHLNDIERSHITNMLEKTRWRVAGKGGAAEALGIKRTTLYSKMKRLGIRRPASK